jgi:hypothetical protein
VTGTDARAPTRAFLIGCPRSGTTLLQSLLFAPPDVVSFPETFYFAKVVPSPRERVRRRLRVVSAEAPGVLRDLDSFGVPPDPAPPRLPSIGVSGYAQRFVRRMDRAAADSGAVMWLEKTPKHARYVDRIESEVPGARFIHLIRAGEAVAASLQDASNRDPAVWPSSTPPQLVEVWRRYLRISLRCVGRPNHCFVSYERLVAEPGPVMSALCESLGLRCDPVLLERMLAGYAASSEKVIGRLVRGSGEATIAAEPWKAGTDGAIANRNQAKLQSLFSEAERAVIIEAVAAQDAAVASIPFL